MTKGSRQRKVADHARSIRWNSCGWYLKMLGTLMDERLNENLKPLGLTLSQFAIIMVLLEEDGLTQVEIGRRVLLIQIVEVVGQRTMLGQLPPPLRHIGRPPRSPREPHRN